MRLELSHFLSLGLASRMNPPLSVFLVSLTHFLLFDSGFLSVSVSVSLSILWLQVSVFSVFLSLSSLKVSTLSILLFSLRAKNFLFQPFFCII